MALLNTLAASFRSWFEKGFLYLLSANFLAQFLSFVTSLVVTRFLTPTALGETKILQSYIIFFLVFAGYGFSAAMLKYGSEERSEAYKAALLRLTLLRALLFTAGTLGTVALLALAGLVTRTAYLTRWLLIYLLAVPFIVSYDVLLASLQASRRIKEMSRLQAIYKTITFFCVVLGAWRWGMEGFVIGTILASMLGLLPLARTIGLRRIAALGAWRQEKFAPPAGYGRMVFFSMLANSILILGQYGDMFILDHFVADRQAIGHYSLATYFFIAATQVTNTIQAILIPYFSAYGRDRKWFDRHLLQNQLLTSGLSLGVAAGVNLVAWVLVRYIYGPSYQATLPFLLILSLRYILSSSYAIIAGALIGIEMVKFNFFAIGISTGAGLLLSYLFQARYGIWGVAWAQVLAALLALGLELYWVQQARKMLELKPG